jgi:HEAT repeat protein
MKSQVLTIAAAVLVSLPGTTLSEQQKKPTLAEQAQAHFHYTMAMHLNAEKNRVGAIKEYTKTIEKDPTQAWAFHRRGTLYSLQGDHQKALADLKRAVELDDSILYAHYNRACLLAQQKQLPEAFASLETAIRKGYRKLNNLEKDPDLAALREQAKYKELLGLLRKLNDTEKPSDQQRFQTADAEGRAAIVGENIDKPGKETREIASLALHDHILELRLLGVQLLASLKTAEARRLLLKALYDSNGYVKKAAANALIAGGKDSEPLVLPILDTKDDHAIFYAVQILGRIGDKKGAVKLVRLLKHDDRLIRTQAALALGRLEAVEALPQIEELLKALKETPAGKTLEIEVQQVIEHLRAIKEKRKGP